MMATFLRLLAEKDKEASLTESCARVRRGLDEDRCFEVTPESFDVVPGEAFAYWVSSFVRSAFVKFPSVSGNGRSVSSGPDTGQDFRCIRTWWECASDNKKRWEVHSKGGEFSRFYADVHLLLLWGKGGHYLKNIPSANIRNEGNYFRPGLTWSLRTTSGLSLRAMPAGCILGHKGPAIFVRDDKPEDLLALLALTNSQPFSVLVGTQLAAADAAARSYEVGVIQKTPIPNMSARQQVQLAELARTAWSLKRTLDTTNETSHAFVLPTALRGRLGYYDPKAIEAELASIQAEIDTIAFDLYGFSAEDRRMAEGGAQLADAAGDEENEEPAEEAPSLDALLSWAAGVAFGRFDWRLATSERAAPGEPEPYDPLPAKSPGMLPDDATSFNEHTGILVDDAGHEHDLSRLVEAVLDRVNAPVDRDIRRWLRKDFFKYHLQQYSKSRRKAPIYWPLATSSGDYNLWVYYPQLTSQTLFTAVNDFVEPKLREVAEDIAALRQLESNRSRQDERRLEALVDFEAELTELHDTLLAIAPGYKPDQDDGVQITAAPLWQLFRHTPWRKALKETWERLERGDYDWSKLAMAYWPDRVREKCVTDKSLAITHDMEHLYEPPSEASGKQGKKD